MYHQLKDKPLNHQTSTDEKVSLSSLISMTKMLKLERGDHEWYPPQRLVIENAMYHYDTRNTVLPQYNRITNTATFTFSVPIKFVQKLHPSRTMVLVENLNITAITTTNPFFVPFDIQLPDVPSSRDWYVQYENNPGEMIPAGTDGYSKLYTSQPGNIIRSGITLAQNNNLSQNNYNFNNYIQVNTNMVGFPITDLQYLNNNTIIYMFDQNISYLV